MPDIALPEDILQIIWRYVYSDYVIPSISKQAMKINKNLRFYSNHLMEFAINYNVLRILSGIKGLSYSS
jgi:hypothetical protein